MSGYCSLVTYKNNYLSLNISRIPLPQIQPLLHLNVTLPACIFPHPTATRAQLHNSFLVLIGHGLQPLLIVPFVFLLIPDKRMTDSGLPAPLFLFLPACLPPVCMSTPFSFCQPTCVPACFYERFHGCLSASLSNSPSLILPGVHQCSTMMFKGALIAGSRTRRRTR